MAAEVTVEEVTEALKEVYDPEIPVNVVDLGLIYGVEVDEQSNVHVDMTLTAAGCGMGPFIAQQAEWAIADLDGVKDVNVEITFDPPGRRTASRRTAASSWVSTTNHSTR